VPSSPSISTRKPSSHPKAPERNACAAESFERFRTAHGDTPIGLLPPEWIEALLDSKPPHAARSWLMTLRSLCQFSIKRGWLRADLTAA
jgi:hypothetical protein